MAGRAKENLPGGSLKYQFVHEQIRIFRCTVVSGGFLLVAILFPERAICIKLSQNGQKMVNDAKPQKNSIFRINILMH